MDTKTAKTEALYILSVIERGSGDAEFLGEARRKFYALMKAQACDRRDYLDSVDACLTLISEHRYTVHHLMGSFRVRLYPENADVEGVYADARSLSISMLKAWWTAQD